MREGVCALLWIVCGTALFAVEDTVTFADRLKQVRQDVGYLEILFEKQDDREFQRHVLRDVIKHSAWLEQVGGLSTARSNHMMALARLQILGEKVVARYGYLSANENDAERNVQVVLTIRDAKPSELPESLRSIRPPPVFIQVYNLSAYPMDTMNGPFIEVRDLLGKRERVFAAPASSWPKVPEAVGTLLRWPTLIPGGTKLQRLVIFPKDTRIRTAVGLSIKQTNALGTEQRSLRALLVEHQEPDAFRAALQLATREHALRKRILDRQKALRAMGAFPVKKPEPKPVQKQKKKIEVISASIGTVTAKGKGRGVKIQVHINLGETLKPGEYLRIRKGGRWRGYLKVDANIIAQAVYRKPYTAHWVTIVGGIRNELAGGTIHHMER